MRNNQAILDKAKAMLVNSRFKPRFGHFVKKQRYGQTDRNMLQNFQVFNVLFRIDANDSGNDEDLSGGR